MAYMSTIISGAASLGVLIGLISGIFFLVLTALKWVCRVRASLYEEELRRQKKFLINSSYLADNDDPDFRETKKTENGFACTMGENNVQEKINQRFQKKPEGATHWRERETGLTSPEKEDPNFDTIKVRELIEKMVETMIGGPLDGTTVGQMSTHSSCKNAFEVDPTDKKQTNLKRLINRIVSEAIALPDIKSNIHLPKASNKMENEDFKNKSYEDILATAILNKVIDNFQNKNTEKEKKDGKPKPKIRNKKIRKTDENKSEDDWSDTSRSDQLSLTIEEYIEEVTTTVEASDSDAESDYSDFETISNRRIPFPESGKIVVDGADDENSDSEEQNTATELITSTSSWEENWLFQKKRLRSTPNAHHPVPVPMLVPNPSEDFRALVGGVDADDLSDMSDCNDTVLEDLITSKEKNQAQQLHTDCEARKELDVIVAERNSTEELKETQTYLREEFFRENKEMSILNSDIPNANENNCDEALKEDEKCKDPESSEDTGKNLTSLNSSEVLSQKDRDSSIENFSHQYESINSPSPSEGAVQTSTSTESEDCQMICRLAEKEKEKWMNPVPLVDNPYSLENINKREERKKNEYFRIGTHTGESVDFPENLPSEEFSKKETDKLRFSRDYYVNASKQPSGMSSPCFEERSEEYDQVSTHSYEALSSIGCSGLEKNTKYNSYPYVAQHSTMIFTLEKQLKNLFPLLQNQTTRRRHFSEVFKTSTISNDNQPKSKTLRKYRYGCHALKSRPKIKEDIFRKASLEQELSDFEQKSLREDLKHSLLRARGASPNFILNPVFKPEGTNKSSETEPIKALLLYENKDNLKHEDINFDESEPIKLFDHQSESEMTTSWSYKAISRVSHESGYGSDSLDYSSDSLECWRLTPPKTPEVVESSLISIVKNRKNKENLRKVRKSLSGFY